MKYPAASPEQPHGWRAVRCAARETPRALVQIGPRSWSAILDHCPDGLRIVFAVFESRPPGGVPSGSQRKAPRRGAGAQGVQSETLEGSCLTFTPKLSIGVELGPPIGIQKGPL